ncbi:MAG: hypothetical protein V8R46_01505 [Eubacterium ramulus]
MNITELTKEIINGRRLTRDDDLSFLKLQIWKNWQPAQMKSDRHYVETP